LKIVYDKTYPPNTTDFAPIVRAIQASNPDLVVICSYPLDSIGMVKAINEIGFKPKMLGGAMVGLQASVFKTQLGPLLNGIVNYETWIPAATLQFPGSMELLKKYQARAAAEGVDPLGYYMPVWAYAYLQVLGDAIEATKSTKDDVLADYMRKTTFKTVVGDVKFGAKGEWAEDRMLLVQFQNIKSNSLDEFRDLSTEVIIDPPQYKSGNLIYPYGEAKK
jgi:branched-chain amino acid transport system substrate-binding protein